MIHHLDLMVMLMVIGVRDPNDDEFVEFVNDTDSIIDLSGYKIYDAD